MILLRYNDRPTFFYDTPGVNRMLFYYIMTE